MMLVLFTGREGDVIRPACIHGVERVEHDLQNDNTT